MKKAIYLLICSVFSCFLYGQKQITRFEKSEGSQTAEYHEVIEWWEKLDKQYSRVKMLKMGMTDSGFPLHLILLSSDPAFEISKSRDKDKSIVLINNGIHAGEPDGIDASMLLARDYLSGVKKLPANIVLAIIPVYNIGGFLNRSAYYRVDQNGPEEFGFRGNAQNLDLNRDFIKADSKNAASFAEIFHLCDPDVFIDNHVSNGADYQHVITLLTYQHNKLGGIAGKYLNERFEPELYRRMKEKGYELVPYVSFAGTSP